jgi:hypothetical protein
MLLNSVTLLMTTLATRVLLALYKLLNYKHTNKFPNPKHLKTHLVLKTIPSEAQTEKKHKHFEMTQFLGWAVGGAVSTLASLGSAVAHAWRQSQRDIFSTQAQYLRMAPQEVQAQLNLMTRPQLLRTLREFVQRANAWDNYAQRQGADWSVDDYNEHFGGELLRFLEASPAEWLDGGERLTDDLSDAQLRQVVTNLVQKHGQWQKQLEQTIRTILEEKASDAGKELAERQIQAEEKEEQDIQAQVERGLERLEQRRQNLLANVLAEKERLDVERTRAAQSLQAELTRAESQRDIELRNLRRQLEENAIELVQLTEALASCQARKPTVRQAEWTSTPYIANSEEYIHYLQQLAEKEEKEAQSIGPLMATHPSMLLYRSNPEYPSRYTRRYRQTPSTHRRYPYVRAGTSHRQVSL